MPNEFPEKLILASASPRRRELLASLGLDLVFLGDRVLGSYTNVVGLPLAETMGLIRDMSGSPWQAFSRAQP